MAGTEGIGGVCPKCSYDNTFYKYGTNLHYLHMQACPNCGFGVAQTAGEDAWSPEEVFEWLLELEDVNNFKDLKKRFEMQAPEEHDDEIEHIFNLSNEEVEKCVWSRDEIRASTETLTEMDSVIVSLSTAMFCDNFVIRVRTKEFPLFSDETPKLTILSSEIPGLIDAMNRSFFFEEYNIINVDELPGYLGVYPFTYGGIRICLYNEPGELSGCLTLDCNSLCDLNKGLNRIVAYITEKKFKEK